MLRVIVLSLMYVGSANMYTSGEYKKILKKGIKNKDRYNMVVKTSESFRGEQVAFEKQIESQIEKFQSIYDEDRLTHEGMEAYFDEVEAMYSEYYIKRADARMELASVMTEKEWKKVYGGFVKGHPKILEARKNRYAYLDSEIAKVNEAFDASIEVEDDLVSAKESVERIRLAFHAFYKASDNIHIVDNPVLAEKASSKEEVLAVFKEWDQARAKFYDDLISETRKMSEYLSDAEWDVFIERLKDQFE